MSNTLKDAIKKLSSTPNQAIYSVVGKVKSVDETARTCEVVPIQNQEDTLFDVRLQAELNLMDGLIITPAIDSLVVVTFLNQATGYIALCSKADKIEAVIDKVKVSIDTTGMLAMVNQSVLEIASDSLVHTHGTNKIEVAADGVTIAGAATTLGKVIDGILTELIALQTIAPTGLVSVVNPASIAKLTALKALSNTLLK